MKIVDTIDTGSGVELEDKSVSQVLNLVGLFHSALERCTNQKEVKETLKELARYHVEIQRRVAVGLRVPRAGRPPSIGAK